VFEPIGHVRSPFPEKFGVPRQPGLAPAVHASIELDPARVQPESLRGLDQATHVWVIFGFHLAEQTGAATVRPPRLGGNERIGTLASRSPFRPNPIGLSAVELVAIEGLVVGIAGGDFVDKTPVYDLKPYLPYADCIVQARCAWADQAPRPMEVDLAPDAHPALVAHPDRAALTDAIRQTLRWDPRPAYRKDEDPGRVYGMKLADLDVRWRVEAGRAVVTEIEPA
jgi:tRNA-Thr(GGU) m(6)t(6)A37 methyltransferase TsaA